MITLCGRFLRSFSVVYPVNIALRPDGRLLVGCADRRRVELMTLSGSLLQVRLPHVCVARLQHMTLLATAQGVYLLPRYLSLYLHVGAHTHTCDEDVPRLRR